jgi:hypothetical protein
MIARVISYAPYGHVVCVSSILTLQVDLLVVTLHQLISQQYYYAMASLLGICCWVIIDTQGGRCAAAHVLPQRCSKP